MPCFGWFNISAGRMTVVRANTMEQHLRIARATNNLERIVLQRSNWPTSTLNHFDAVLP